MKNVDAREKRVQIRRRDPFVEECQLDSGIDIPRHARQYVDLGLASVDTEAPICLLKLGSSKVSKSAR
jgi:hypothetical protein